MTTVNDIYLKSKQWIFEKRSSTIYNDYIIEIMNKVLAETHDENNMCRMFHGKKPLKTIPQVKTLSDELDDLIEQEYLLDVIPKGIDANFLLDDDLTKMAKYDTEYNNARVSHQKMVDQETIDELEKEDAS